jgi:hypothetical protein
MAASWSYADLQQRRWRAPSRPQELHPSTLQRQLPGEPPPAAHPEVGAYLSLTVLGNLGVGCETVGCEPPLFAFAFALY